jgi:hypothetical protein
LVRAIQLPFHEAEEVSVTIKLFASMGIIPFFIGVAFVIIHYFEKKKCGNEQA